MKPPPRESLSQGAEAAPVPRPRAHLLRLLLTLLLLCGIAAASLTLFFAASGPAAAGVPRWLAAHGLRLSAAVPRWLRRLQSHSARLRAPVFSSIAAADAWNSAAARVARDSGASHTLAGPGSTLNYTAAARQFLGAVIAAHGVRSMADLSCSELHWQMQIEGFWQLDSFAGYDIVPAVVETARARAEAAAATARAGGGATPTFTFAVADSVSDAPFPAVDLVILRDTLMHLPLHDALAVLARIDASDDHIYGSTRSRRQCIHQPWRLVRH